MTPWLLFGAGGKGVGARTLELALAEQRPVVAVVRHADAATKLAQQGVQVFTGDACDASVVAAACRAAGPDALVISTMGGAQDYLAHRTVIDEAEKAGISIATITKMGKDGAVVSSEVLVKICSALGCTMDDIVEIIEK